MTAPAISVILPTYNRAAFLGRALASVQAQTFRDFELLVVDDRSTDATAQLLQEAARGEPRLRVLENRRGRGPGAARNAGLAVAQGEWLAFLDSDDVWEPRKLERFLQAAAPEVVLIGGDYRMLDRESGSGQTLRDFLLGTMIPWWESDPLARRVIDCARLRADSQTLCDPAVVIAMTVGGCLWPQTSSVMARRSDVQAEGGFETRLARTEDMDLWLKLLARGRFAYVDEVLATCDITGRSGGRGDRYAAYDEAHRHNAFTEFQFHLRFLQGLPRRVTLDADALAFLRERIAAHHRMCGHAARGARPLTSAWHYAAALWSSAGQRRLLRQDRRRFFAQPW